MNAIAPNPIPPVAVADGTLRNQPRLATWFRTDVCERLVRGGQTPLGRQVGHGARRLAEEQRVQQDHLVRCGGPVRVDQGDPELVLPGALDRQAPRVRRDR